VPKWPGWDISLSGIKPKAPSSDQIRFSEPIRSWKPVQTSDISQVALLVSGPGAPTKSKFNLLSAGPSFFFTSGVQLLIGSTGSPFLSWGEGSVDSGVPTPNVKWVLLSYRDNQPPVLIVFEGEPASLKIGGRPGDWVVKTEGVYQGWVRFVLPVGTKEVPTNSAASLGALGKAVEKNLDVLTQPGPNLLGVDVKEDLSGIDATYRFDRSGAILPFPIQQAPAGGYPLKVKSPIRDLGIEVPEGSLSVAGTSELRIRFPVRRVPTGRGLGLGAPDLPPLSTVSHLDVPSVAELAMENLVSSRDVRTKLEGERVVGQFLQDAVASKEPATGQTLLYSGDGVGMDLAAAHALLMQSLSISSQANSEANSILTSLTWRRDWLTWQFEGVDPEVARRAACLSALAGSLCPEGSRRLDAAMIEAGSAAMRAKWTKMDPAAKPKPLVEPYFALRRMLFGADNVVKNDDAFGKVLLSEIRVFGDTSVTLQSVDGGLQLKWEAGGTSQTSMILASGYPLNFENGNLAGFEVVQALGFTQLKVRAAAPGPCYVKLKVPTFAKPFAPAISPPEYDEAPR
jgi:hypothetical protein